MALALKDVLGKPVPLAPKDGLVQACAVGASVALIHLVGSLSPNEATYRSQGHRPWYSVALIHLVGSLSPNGAIYRSQGHRPWNSKGNTTKALKGRPNLIRVTALMP